MQNDAVWISKGNESGSMSLTGPKKDVGCVTESFYSTTFDRQSPGKTRKTVYTQRFVLKIPNFKRPQFSLDCPKPIRSISHVLNDPNATPYVWIQHHVIGPYSHMWVSLPGVSWSNKFNPFCAGFDQIRFCSHDTVWGHPVRSWLKDVSRYVYIYIYLTHVHHKL